MPARRPAHGSASASGYSLFLRIILLIAPRIERPPVALLGAGRAVDEIGKLAAAAPGGFAGFQHLGVLAEREPGIQHLARRGAGGAAQLDAVAHIAAGERVR